MAKQRKLFVTHAGELAHRLVRAVRPHGMIVNFATSYARRHHRVGVVDEPNRVRELESTLGREAILIMVAEVLRLMPSALGGRKGIPLGTEEAAFFQMFQSEFMTALGRALEWPADELDSEQEAFDRDLLMYRRWFERVLTLDARLPQEGISPFLDRCALLLDPSTMEKAREAAAKFEKEITAAAAHIFELLGRSGSERAHKQKTSRTPRSIARKPGSRSHGTSRTRPKEKKKSVKKVSGARRTKSRKRRRK
jgi:hypothetical protein